MTRPIRPIRNETDYNDALARVEALMDGDPSEDERDEMDVLATLIERYEDERFPINPPDPIAAIRFRMEQLGKTQSDLTPIFGSRAKVSEVLGGKRELTLKMIRALRDHLGIPAEVLIREPGAGLPEPLGCLEKLPLKDMAKLGWIRFSENMDDFREEILNELISCAGGRQALPQALFRQGAGANAKMDIHALQAWCLHVLCAARRLNLEGVFKQGSITLEFMQDTARLSVFDDGPRLAREHLERHGIALITARHLPKTYLDGAAMRTIDGVPVIGMTLRYDRLDNFWFCLMHELAHLGRHFDNGDDKLFIDDLQLRERDHTIDDHREAEADQWAEEALIPSELWDAHPARNSPTVANVMSLAARAKVHPAIVAGRVRFENKSYRLLTQFVGANLVRPMLMGHDPRD